MNFSDYRDLADILPFRLSFDHLVLLTGSKGWGIEESTHSVSDYDFLILCNRDDFARLYNNKMTIISTEYRSEKCFIQVRSFDWLHERLNSDNYDIQILYQWIITNCNHVLGNPITYEFIKEKSIKKYQEKHLKYLVHYAIKYKVREYDMKSAKKRNLKLEYNIYKNSYIENAIKLLSNLYFMPFPYPKWYSKHIILLNIENKTFLNMLKSDNLQFDNELINIKAKQKDIEDFLMSRICSLDALLHHKIKDIFDNWWIYNEN